ncbi:MAG: hypothetical protein IKZ46_03990 [Victivallales bacterium]|nr:hypothetical protein [Victivallales bacterium]
MKGECVNCLFAFLLVMMMPLMGSCGVKRSPEARKHYIICTTNLKLLTMGMLIWAEEHEGELPEAQGWEEKVNQSIEEDKYFSCPSCKKHYIYLGNGQKQNAFKEPSKVIVFICEGDHMGKTNVAFLDGHIDLLDTEEVEAAVEAAKANGSLPQMK